ncbi:MLP-like protein 43 [Chenopodium quinoa]|uniref:Bet v I/Major latex protein domain-containing protein n=1 Tax=Chenopodium quinoa TaxID=63459 RepID=A0A803M8K1_CHEQI|nr:MLP-like protein 43 [Chenopodium quinoa]
MSLKRKLEGEVEIRAGAGDVYHEIYESRPHHVSHAAPHFVESCDVVEGEFGKPGSIILWKYKTGGKPLVAKILVEEIDKEKKLVKHKCIEGDMLDDYKTISGTGQVIPKDSVTSIVRWTLEYEKLHPGAPEPTALLDHMLNAAKDIDDHHHGIKK